MNGGLFDVFEEEDKNDIDFGKLYEAKEAKETKSKKKKIVSEETELFPVDALFSTPPVVPVTPAPIVDSSFVKPNFRKDIPQDVVECIMTCLCPSCKAKIEEYPKVSLFNDIPVPKPKPISTLEAEQSVMDMFDDDDDDNDIEDDDDGYEDDDDDIEEESSIESRADIVKMFGNGGFEEEENENENNADFFGQSNF